MSDIERQTLIKLHTSIIEDARNTIGASTKKLMESTTRLVALENYSIDEKELTVRIHGGLIQTMTLSEKVVFVLIKQGKIATTREIAELIVAENPEELNGIDLGTLVSRISATLKQKFDKGDTFSRATIDKEIYYGLGSWFENGAVVHAFVPKSAPFKLEYLEDNVLDDRK
ncbi:MAG: hypothetical protein ABI378_11435 [Chitinophagaceae bacterium]